MKFGRNQPRSQPIVRVARLAGPELVLLPSSRHTYQTADGPVIAVPMREKRRRAVKPKDANYRVGGWQYCHPPLQEPCMRVSQHTAHAFQRSWSDPVTTGPPYPAK
jgi:hypothetical protein